jgi:predicted DNA-binding protein with PD1-like motif
VFVVRLEDGDILHEEIENLAQAENIRAGAVIIVGGADEGSRLVVGPEKGRVEPAKPMEHVLKNVHEAAGTGTLFPNEEGKPKLHMHMACGRKSDTVTGCVRKGVKVWWVMEAVLIELVDTTATRAFEPRTGFELLLP